MSEKVDLSIIIVSWNVRDHLKKCLNSIFEARENLSLEIFVVDNNSSDGSAKIIETKFQKVKLIKNKKNLGFAKANNQAIKKSKAEFILLLNPDTQVLKNTLSNMLNWMKKNPQAKIAGCHLIDKQGQTIPHVRRFPSVWNQLAIILKLPHLFPSVLNKYLRKNFDYTKPQKVDSIRGGFFMMRLLAGGEPVAPAQCQNELDERYFLWFEEVDFCRQVYKSGNEVWYTPTAQCIDYVGQSFKQIKRGQTQKYFRDSMLKYFRKWHPLWQYWLLKLAWPIGLGTTWLGEKVNLKSKTKT